MAELLMPLVRAVLSEGDTEYVRPAGSHPAPEEVPYDALKHAGSLRCLFCEAAVHHNTGSSVIAGGYKGRRAHFVTDPGSIHGEDCLLPPRPEDKSVQSFDKNQGYRLHINTLNYSDRFNLAAGPYEYDENGRLRLKDQSLAKMETESISNVQDVARLLRRGDFERLNKSVVMLRDRQQPLRWSEFLIRYGRGEDQSRYQMLADRTDCHDYQPAALEFVTKGTGFVRREDWLKGKLSAESTPIFNGMVGRRADFLVPRIWLDNRDDTRVRDALQSEGRYLVLGIPRLSMPFIDYGTRSRYLDIKVTDHRQIMRADLAQLTEAGRRNAARHTQVLKVE